MEMNPRKKITIVIPVYKSYKLLEDCLSSISTALDSMNLKIIVWSDGDSIEKINAANRRGYTGDPSMLTVTGTDSNNGYTKSVNLAMEEVTTKYAVIVNSDVKVYEGWITGILDAFDHYENVGTVSTLSNAGSILSVPIRNTSVSDLAVNEWNEIVAEYLRKFSRRVFPIISTPVGHVLGVDVSKWRELNGFDEIYSPGYGEEVDLGERMCMKGYINILADQVWVSHKKSASFGDNPSIQKIRENHEKIVNKRFPAYGDKTNFSATNSGSALSRAISESKTVFFGVSDSVISNTIFPDKLLMVQSVNRLTHGMHQTMVKVLYSSRIGLEDFEISEEVNLVLLVDELISIENQYRDISDAVWRLRRDKTFLYFQRANSIIWKNESLFNYGKGIFGDLSQATNLIHLDVNKSDISDSSDSWLSDLLPVSIYQAHETNIHKLRCQNCSEVFCNHEISAAFLVRKPIVISNLMTSRKSPLNIYENQLNQSGKFGRLALTFLTKHPVINQSIIPIGSKRRVFIGRIVQLTFSMYRRLRRL